VARIGDTNHSPGSRPALPRVPLRPIAADLRAASPRAARSARPRSLLEDLRLDPREVLSTQGWLGEVRLKFVCFHGL